MTVYTTASETEYSGNGSATAFPVPFRFTKNTDLVVTLTNSLGVSQGLVIGVDYTVSGAGSESGGVVTTVVAPPANTRLAITRALEPVQETDFRNQGSFLAETHESAFDYLTMLIQQGLSVFSRALTRPLGKNYYDAENYRISNVGDPLLDQDAATKKWTSGYVADVLQTGQGPANNAENVIYADPVGNITTVADALDGIDQFLHIYDVVVAYGQSNALGLAGLSGDTSGYPAMLPTSLMFDPDTSTIKPLVQNMKSVNGETSTGHAWGEFANEYYRQTKRGVIVVNAARGGMSIATLSKGDASGYYTKMIAGANNAVAAASLMGLTVGRRLVCWHQGETDQQNNTSFEQYRNALENLVANINADWPILLFGICTVGSPLTRQEVTWAQIQNAQRYFARTNSKAAIVFDGCPTFSIADGIINASGTDEHYSQKGYNLMGYHAARGFAEVLDRASRVKTADEIAEYGGSGKVGAPWCRAERVSAHVFYSNGAWRISSKDTSLNDFRSAGVAGVSANDNSIRVKLSGRADFMFETYAKVSQVGAQYGITPHISRTVVNGEFFIELNFYLDLRIVASLSNGGLFFGRPIAALPSWLSSFVSSSLNGGVLTLTHGATTQVPMVSHNGGGGALNGQPAAVYSAAPSATSTLVSFGTGAQPANPAVNIGIDRMLIPNAALAALPGFAFEMGATIAAAN